MNKLRVACVNKKLTLNLEDEGSTDALSQIIMRNQNRLAALRREKDRKIGLLNITFEQSPRLHNGTVEYQTKLFLIKKLDALLPEIERQPYGKIIVTWLGEKERTIRTLQH